MQANYTGTKTQIQIQKAKQSILKQQFSQLQSRYKQNIHKFINIQQRLIKLKEQQNRYKSRIVYQNSFLYQTINNFSNQIPKQFRQISVIGFVAIHGFYIFGLIFLSLDFWCTEGKTKNFHLSFSGFLLRFLLSLLYLLFLIIYEGQQNKKIKLFQQQIFRLLMFFSFNYVMLSDINDYIQLKLLAQDIFVRNYSLNFTLIYLYIHYIFNFNKGMNILLGIYYCLKLNFYKRVLKYDLKQSIQSKYKKLFIAQYQKIKQVIQQISQIQQRGSQIQIKLNRKFNQLSILETCSICSGLIINKQQSLKLIRTIIVLDCSHTFHTACISKWTRSTNKNCPVCRRQILIKF